MPCLPEYTVTLSPSRIAAPREPSGRGLPAGPFEIESYRKVANGTYGEGLFYLCGYTGDLKPLLDQHLEVKDAEHNPCYCGYVAEVYRCCGEYVAWGWSNATLYNRIAVTWSEGGVTQITPWQSNRPSMQTHGVRELVVSLPSSSLYTPAQYAQRLLKELSEPRPILHNTYKCRCNVTYLRTQGYYATLAWQSYHNLCGLADTGATFAHAQKLGIGFTSDQLAVNGSTNGESQIGEIGAHLLAFESGDLLLMSGWSNPQNNIVTTVTDFIKDDFFSITSDGISTVANRIQDANNSLILFHPDELIQVNGSGSGDLDGYYWVRTENDGSILEVQHENFPGVDYSGIPITITHGVTINVPSNLAQEDPGARVTIKAWDQYLCQRICNECGESWTATHLQIAVRRQGSPTADISLRVKAGCGSATHLAWAVLNNSALGTTIGTTFAYHTVELSTPIILAPGQCVYVEVHVVNREPSGRGVNDYYEFGGSLAQTTAMRALTGLDGASWTATKYTAAMQLIERKSITDQLADLVALGDVVAGVTVLDHLTYTAPTYRSGYTSLLYAIEQLLIMGDPEGNRLQLQLDCDGNAIIRTEPTLDSEPCTVLDCCSCATGALCTQTAGRWLCPVSADLVDVPGVFLEEMIVSYKSCRARYVDRDFSRTLFNQALRFPGVI